MEWASEAADAGVVDQNVEAAESLVDVCGERLDGAEMHHIADDGFGLTASFDDRVGSGFEWTAGAPGKHDGCAHAGDFGGDRGSDAAPGSRDECDPAGQAGFVRNLVHGTSAL